MESTVSEVTPLEGTRMIINHWSKEFRNQYGDKFPTDYTCFDTETTGFSRDKDLIVEWGHCIVRDRKVIDNLSVMINWFGAKLVPDEWISAALKRVGRKVKLHTGRTFHVTEEKMRKKGVPVDEAMPWMFDLLKTIVDNGEFLVSHNGWNYDVQMLEAHARDFMGQAFNIPDNQMIDTGAVEKASQMMDDDRLHPQPGETMKEYFKRVAYFRAPGIQWNLADWCFQKYRLAEKYGADPAKAHRAGYDAWMLHLLMEEYRGMAEQAAEPAMPKVRPALKSRNPNVQKTRRSEEKQAKTKGLAESQKKRRRGQRNR
jgi:DNA polymerase III epsilon subunit-like protein